MRRKGKTAWKFQSQTNTRDFASYLSVCANKQNSSLLPPYCPYTYKKCQRIEPWGA